MANFRYVPILLLGSFLTCSVFAGFEGVEEGRQLPNFWENAKQQLDAQIAKVSAGSNKPTDKKNMDDKRYLGMLYWEVGTPKNIDINLHKAQNVFRELYDADLKLPNTEYKADMVRDLRHLTDSYVTFGDFKDALWAARKTFDYDREHGQDKKVPLAIDWNNMGMTYFLSGSVQKDPKERKANFDYAELCYKQAEATFRAQKATASLAANLFNQSLLARDRGDYREGERLDKAARATLADAQEEQ